MKYATLAMIVLIVFTVGCDTKLGHEDHDHDGDGVQDHAPEDHHEEGMNHEEDYHTEEILHESVS